MFVFTFQPQKSWSQLDQATPATTYCGVKPSVSGPRGKNSPTVALKASSSISDTPSLKPHGIEKSGNHGNLKFILPSLFPECRPPKKTGADSWEILDSCPSWIVAFFKQKRTRAVFSLQRVESQKKSFVEFSVIQMILFMEKKSCSSWGWYLIPLFTGFSRLQV